MIRVFEFDDYLDYGQSGSYVVYVDINKEIQDLIKDGWEILSIQRQVLDNHYQSYNRWDKNCYTVVAKKEESDD